METAKNMSGNGEKLSRQRQEQQRPSLPNHSCPVFISSSPSRISFSSSHGRNSLSTKEKETRIHLTSIIIAKATRKSENLGTYKGSGVGYD